ncbi:methylenetetrahydrofolate reductase [Neokomagataea thailandica]|uniref:Methylenetetrahydrofolate reductase n=1 Tax=Neokomagataea tanensis NBRC 106556 TaxID=1223519 RepID=A0ABQ0QGR8_9PROT|nr:MULTISPECIES: methylenetetrahydrofolate reductase [Neokomagataea]GBR44253.1 5,10-methylenetetrahydrofolate reductase [Neokomagataea tanensis NBRC 106556]
MTRVSLELVPRTLDALMADVSLSRDVFPQLGLLNIPDLLRFDVRSYRAAEAVVAQTGVESIPHIRAIDVDPDAPLPGTQSAELKAVLVVAGDPAPEGYKTYSQSSVDIIERYRREAPHLDVYAVFDPYRRAPWQELEDVKRKKDAGAKGFFTQPLFDVNMLRLCMDWMRDETVFWGISPVLGEKSRAYWTRVNHIVFPHDYDTSLEGNIQLARKMLELIRIAGDNAYLMPLRVDLGVYLRGLEGLI